jgi:hypothetical protein
MTTPRPPFNPMRIVYDIIITFMETLGLFLTSFGLGVFASWAAGTAVFSAKQQRDLSPKPAGVPVPPNWPPTQSAPNGTEEPPPDTRSRVQRFADWVHSGS